MKAFLLAAGVGSRLRPITDTVPKCLLTVGGRPMLDHWLDALSDAGVDEVLVNVHHLPHAVRSHLSQRVGPPRTLVVHEPELLGSAGTLLANRARVESEDFFLVCNADNLTDFDVRALVDHHRRADGEASVAVFHAPDPRSCGILELSADGIVVRFEEKPRQPRGDLANAGIYVFAPSVLDLVGGAPPLDIGYDLLPRLVGRARALCIDGYFRDIGTPEAYREAQQDWLARSAP